MPYKENLKQREYQKLWMKNRRIKYMSILGDKCEICGSTESLELDHINRDTKISHKIWSWKEDRLLEELNKCQILCHNCHLEKTISEMPNAICGTNSMYNGGCRCQECKDAHAKSMREYRANKGR